LQKNQLRIIGGKWRGRKLQFPNIAGLRPTPNRVRETLFNWLMHVIPGSHCLDLFAGSGALGFEALSRGAGKLVFIDESAQVIAQIKRNQQLLKCENVIAYCTQADIYLKQTTEKFDIIFLDPPFQLDIIPQLCKLLRKYNLLKENGFVYIETATKFDPNSIPHPWKIIKQSKAGKVHVALLTYH
jgi:16S rRNA (guanine966-N2)-methyltransferase